MGHVGELQATSHRMGALLLVKPNCRTPIYHIYHKTGALACNSQSSAMWPVLPCDVRTQRVRQPNSLYTVNSTASPGQYLASHHIIAPTNNVSFSVMNDER